jgi:hypothetical protein
MESVLPSAAPATPPVAPEAAQGSEMDLFRAAIKSPETRSKYERWLERFLEAQDIKAGEFARKARESPKWAEGKVLSYVLALRENGLKSQSVASYLAPIKLFCDMNDATGINWRKITRVLPPRRTAPEDRAPTLEEIRLLASDSDYRVKFGVLAMASGGFRVGAWDGMKAKHIEPIRKDGEVVAARLEVYPGTPERYRTYITPEAWGVFDAYLKHRRENGEEVGPESPVLRNLYRPGKAAHPRPIGGVAFRALLMSRYRRHGIRKGAKQNGERFDVAASHGFRKFFKSACEGAGVKSLVVEVLLGHDVGMSGKYYRPTEADLLKEYLKAVPRLIVLTPQADPEVAGEVVALKKRLAELEARAAESAPKKSAVAEILSDPDVLEVIARKLAAKGA